MSRAFDILLLACILLLAWKLVRFDPGLAESPDGQRPIVVKIQVSGEESLVGLGVILRPAEGNEVNLVGADEDRAPHQISPWQANRTTQISVPGPGAYALRWGLQDRKPPRRARNVLKELPKEAKMPDQVIEIRADMTARDVIEVSLTPDHAAGLRAVAGAGDD